VIVRSPLIPPGSSNLPWTWLPETVSGIGVWAKATDALLSTINKLALMMDGTDPPP